MSDIYAFLAEHEIPYELFDHEPVFTCEEAEKLLSYIPGSHTKNIFLRDGKGKRHILVIVGYEKNVDLKELRKVVHADKLSFASPERLKQYLDVEPGSATLLGLVTDTDHAVEVFIDRPLWDAAALQCHPLVNTATLVIAHEGIVHFLKETGHEPQILDVPHRIL